MKRISISLHWREGVPAIAYIASTMGGLWRWRLIVSSSSILGWEMTLNWRGHIPLWTSGCGITLISRWEVGLRTFALPVDSLPTGKSSKVLPQPWLSPPHCRRRRGIRKRIINLQSTEEGGDGARGTHNHAKEATALLEVEPLQTIVSHLTLCRSPRRKGQLVMKQVLAKSSLEMYMNRVKQWWGKRDGGIVKSGNACWESRCTEGSVPGEREWSSPEKQNNISHLDANNCSVVDFS